MFENKKDMEKDLQLNMCDDPELLAEMDQCEGIDYVFDSEGNVIETTVVKGSEKAE